MATHSHQISRETPFCLFPADWHKDPWLVRALLAHPLGGERKVAAVAEVLRGDASYVTVARRAGVSTATVLQWEDELLRVVRRDLWRAYKRQRDEAQRIKTHPFVAYYAD